MPMQKLEEFFSEDGITTIFDLTPDRSSLGLTNPCGLGWQYNVVMPSATLGGRLRDTQDIRVYVEPHSAFGGSCTMLVRQTKEDKVLQQERISPHANFGERLLLISCTVAQARSFPVLSFTLSFAQRQTKATLLPQSAKSSNIVGLHNILAQSMSEDVMDTKFFLFSRRGPKAPRVIHANSTRLRERCAYLDNLLSSGFGESNLVDLDEPFPGFASGEEDYPYDLDSDFDDSEDEPHPARPEIIAKVRSIEIQDSATSGFNDTTHVDLCATGEVKPTTPSELDEKEDQGVLVNDPSAPALRSPPATEKRPYKNRKGYVIKISDTAHNTWATLVMYLYTGTITFAPLRSELIANPDKSSPIPRCSPKSMYRLAEKLDLPDLRNLAFEAIKSSLKEGNIITELFSEFTSWYPEIQETQVKVFREHRRAPQVVKALRRKITEVLNGDVRFPYCQAVVEMVMLDVGKPFPSPIAEDTASALDD